MAKKEIKIALSLTGLIVGIVLIPIILLDYLIRLENKNLGTNNKDQLTTTSTKTDNLKLQADRQEDLFVTVKNRGQVICGINGNLPGFSLRDENDNYSGLDVDICRAIAVALFDDPEKVIFLQVATTDRFTALATDKVDILSRNTTRTLTRDSIQNVDFLPVVFYDGQGIMTRKNTRINSIEDLEGKSICVANGTTGELNLADKMKQLEMAYQPVHFLNERTSFEGYQMDKCHAITDDKSQLLARKSNFDNPDDHKILSVTLSKEPLAPAIAQGNPRWRNALTWITYSLVMAEELGINSQNLEQHLQNSNPEVQRFLGVTGNLGQSLGLSPDFAARVIKQVGNYGEIYDRNIGAPFNLDRGVNDLWTQGGLMYAHPFR